MLIETILWVVFCFVVGTIVGSFLNVCIFRIPRRQSIVHPGSHCPSCNHPIRPWHNIPIFSFILLRGRCRSCAAPISWRYPTVEALNGILYILVFLKYGISITGFVYAVFSSFLVLISFIDLDHQIIPDRLSLPGLLFVLLPAIGFTVAGYSTLWPITLSSAILGSIIGGGSLLAVAMAYYAFTRREGMGGGDIKLMAVVGGLLGWRMALLSIMLGSMTGVIIMIPLYAIQGKNSRTPLPFGPFLALGSLIAMLAGAELLHWYLSGPVGWR